MYRNFLDFWLLQAYKDSICSTHHRVTMHALYCMVACQHAPNLHVGFGVSSLNYHRYMQSDQAPEVCIRTPP